MAWLNWAEQAIILRKLVKKEVKQLIPKWKEYENYSHNKMPEIPNIQEIVFIFLLPKLPKWIEPDRKPEFKLLFREFYVNQAKPTSWCPLRLSLYMDR